MKSHFLALVGAALCVSHAAHAVEVTGGSVGLSFSGFTDDLDVNRVTLQGSVELGWNRNWSSQLDLAHNRFDASGADTTSFGVHTIYHLNDATSFGLFYTIEEGDGDDVDIVGLEAGHEFGSWDVEGFFGKADSAGAGSANMFGLMGRTELQNGYGVAAEYQTVDVGGIDVERLSVSVDRDLNPTTNLFVEVGVARVSTGTISGSEPFIGLGGTYRFGADRGATFKGRNISQILPGG